MASYSWQRQWAVLFVGRLTNAPIDRDEYARALAPALSGAYQTSVLPSVDTTVLDWGVRQTTEQDPDFPEDTYLVQQPVVRSGPYRGLEGPPSISYPGEPVQSVEVPHYASSMVWLLHKKDGSVVTGTDTGRILAAVRPALRGVGMGTIGTSAKVYPLRSQLTGYRGVPAIPPLPVEPRQELPTPPPMVAAKGKSKAPWFLALAGILGLTVLSRQ